MTPDKMQDDVEQIIKDAEGSLDLFDLAELDELGPTYRIEVLAELAEGYLAQALKMQMQRSVARAMHNDNAERSSDAELLWAQRTLGTIQRQCPEAIEIAKANARKRAEHIHAGRGVG